MRWQRLKSRLTFVLLGTLSVLLFLAVFAFAVWQASVGQEIPPTPTIPAVVEPNFAYVSALSGEARLVYPDQDRARVLMEGDTIEAGTEAVVQVPAAGWLRLGFVNGATVYVGEESAVELLQIADEADGVQETILQLRRGRLLAGAGSAGLRLLIRAESGAEGVLGSEGLAGCRYETELQRFEWHCLEGSCTLAGRSQEAQPVEPGTYRWVQGYSLPFAPRPARYELFQALGDPGVVPTATAPAAAPASATARP